MSYGGEVVSAGDELARGRLSAYTRLAELVLEQEAALEVEDMERFEELTEAVTELRGRLGSPPSQHADPQSMGFLDSGVVDEAARLLRQTLVRSEMIETRLAALRQKTGAEIRQVGAGRTTGRRYLEASDAGPARSAQRVDVKL